MVPVAAITGNLDLWVPVIGQIVALAAAVFAYWKSRHAEGRVDTVHSEVIDVKRATGTNKRAADEAAEPVKPDPVATIGAPQRRHTDGDNGGAGA